MDKPSIMVENIGVRFGGFRALDHIDLEIAPGSLHSIIGPNGAGKTTLFNVLTGRLQPSEGRVRLGTRDITRMAAHGRVHLGIARSFQVTNIFHNLTVAENVRLAVQAVRRSESWTFWRGVSPGRNVEEILVATGLQARAADRAGTLSHGAQRALEIGMALGSDPSYVFLDEPLAGVSIDDIHRIKNLIRSLTPRRTVVLIEHNMRVVLDISDRITVLAQGETIAEGTPADIRANPMVRAAYLGASV
jgi:branched-chain amino acid transport system ATP-binding protein